MFTGLALIYERDKQRTRNGIICIDNADNVWTYNEINLPKTALYSHIIMCTDFFLLEIRKISLSTLLLAGMYSVQMI